MGLANYGVCIGTLNRFMNDGNAGHWLHGLAYLDTPAGQYRCAIDVDHPDVDIQYRLYPSLAPSLFAQVASLAEGYHELAKTPDSGAIDYVRSKLFNPDPGNGAGLDPASWIVSTGDNALGVLKTVLTGSQRVFIFGESFVDTDMSGMHNVHYNQGDPPGPHQADDGIWQDGCTIALRPDGALVAVLTRFTTQTFNTNDHGLPL
jgi:hypothetical protein